MTIYFSNMFILKASEEVFFFRIISLLQISRLTYLLIGACIILLLILMFQRKKGS